jgi:hypothetical protein
MTVPRVARLLTGDTTANAAASTAFPGVLLRQGLLEPFVQRLTQVKWYSFEEGFLLDESTTSRLSGCHGGRRDMSTSGFLLTMC